MKDLFPELARYLSSLGAAKGEWKTLRLEESAPPALTAWYRAFETEVAGRRRPFLLVAHEGLQPADAVAHAKKLARPLGSPLAFVFPSLDREFARRLLDAHVSFVVPRRLVNLPPRFVLLPDDGYSAPPKALPAKLSPSAQLILLWLLQAPGGGDWTEFGTLRKKLIPNRVYLTLAVQELEKRDLVQTRRNGLRKSVRPAGDRHAIWNMAQESLSSPVLRMHRVAKTPKGLPVAGLTALARFSSINDGPVHCVATFRRTLKVKADLERTYDGDIIQEWKYDPRLLSPDGKSVDPLSLFLALRNENDPRVQSALAECLKVL